LLPGQGSFFDEGIPQPPELNVSENASFQTEEFSLAGSKWFCPLAVAAISWLWLPE